MKMELGLRPRLEQRLRLAPQIIQSIEILQLPLLALQERIEQEQNENPALEIGAADDPSPPAQERPERTEEERAPSAEEDFSRLASLEQDFHDYFWQAAQRRSASPEAADQKQEALQNTPGPGRTLREHLLDQLRLMDVPRRQAELAELIIHNLDRDGRLRASLAEVAAAAEGPVDPEEMEAALHVVQSLDPPGVAARDLRECLLLQLDPKHPDFPLLAALLRDHLEDVEQNRLPKVAQALGVELDVLKELLRTLSALDPRPGASFDVEDAPGLTPDVVVEMIGGRYEVRLNDAGLPRLRVNPLYERMAGRLKRGTKEHAFLRQKIDSARWLVDAVQQRRDTLLKISREIVRVQEEFMERGVSGLKPLKMQQVADAAGVHVSTVSRAISQKYMQTPVGIYPMKFFFTGGVATEEGDEGDGAGVTWNAVKARIQEIVDAEDKRHPLSDEDLVAKLAESGLTVARRTVTKYRKQLRIPSSRQRRQY